MRTTTTSAREDDDDDDDDDDAGERELAQKVARVRDRFADVLADGARVEIAPSDAREFRSRCRFQLVRDDDGGVRHAMWESGAPTLRVDDFETAVRGIRRAMRAVPRAVREGRLDEGLEAAHYLASAHEDKVLCTLVYSTPIDEETWVREARRVLETDASMGGIELMGRSKGVAAKTHRDYVVESYALADGTRLTYKHVEGSFSNPNRKITIATMEFLRDCAREIRKAEGRPLRLLELYCGNGNHSCALAGVFERVVAVEIDTKLVRAASESCAMNGVTNVEIVLADSQNFAKRMLRGKFNDAAGNALRAEDFDVVLVDPPRAGLDDDTLELVGGKFKHILYVSCGPDNLLKNIEQGMREHTCKRFAILDHFARTKHIEVAVYMRRDTVD